MSVRKKHSTVSTSRDFSVNKNTLSQISGLFLIDKSEVIPAASIDDFDYWFLTLFKNGSIIPLHGIKMFDPNDEDLLSVVSPQDITLELGKGKYRQNITFNWSAAFHQIVSALSGTDYAVIYYDDNRNVMLYSSNAITYRGLKTSNIIIKKYSFPSQGKAALSVMVLELVDTSYATKKLSWNPADIDRLFTFVTVNATSSKIIVGVKYNGADVDDLEANDFSITDDKHGNVTFGLFTYGGGIYTLSGLSKSLGTGKVTILSTLYLGCERYRATIEVAYSVYDTFESGVYETFESGNYELFNT